MAVHGHQVGVGYVLAGISRFKPTHTLGSIIQTIYLIAPVVEPQPAGLAVPDRRDRWWVRDRGNVSVRLTTDKDSFFGTVGIIPFPPYGINKFNNKKGT